MNDADAVRRVLALAPIEIPRGLLGADARELADALTAAPADPERIVALSQRVAVAHWPELRASAEATLRRTAAFAAIDDDAALARGIEWAAGDDPGNPLALALAGHAAAALGAARARAAERVRAAEPALRDGGRGAGLTLASAVGAVVIDLLDLDPEDFEPELVAYVAADQSAAALDELARATGDPDVRRWARAEVVALSVPDAPAAGGAMAELAAGALPDDPAADAIWVPAVIALAEEAIAMAMVAPGEPRGPPPR